MSLPPEPYLPRRIAPIDTWRTTHHAIKVYGIHRDPDAAPPLLSAPVIDAAQAAVHRVLDEHADQARSHGLGFCIVHVGEEAVWLLVDWWVSGGIVCQRMLSAPLADPSHFIPVSTPALACVWELVITAHERNAWVRHMLTTAPDSGAYLNDLLPSGQY